MKTLRPEDTGLTGSALKSYIAYGQLPNGQLCGIHRLMFHWTMHLGIEPDGCMGGRYCFETMALALAALIDWDGEGDPQGWHKHYPTRQCHSFPQIRCRDTETGEIYRDGEISPRDRRKRRVEANSSASVPSLA